MPRSPNPPDRPTAKAVTISVYPEVLRAVDEFAEMYHLPRSRAVEYLLKKGADAIEGEL